MNQPSLRVVHILPQFPYFGGRAVVGGYAAAALSLTAAQTQVGSHPRILSRTLPDSPTRTYAGVPVQSIGDVRRAGSLWSTAVFVVRACSQVLRDRRSIDLVHVHAGHAEYLIIGWFIGRMTRIPTVQTMYCPPVASGPRRRAQSTIARMAGRHSTLTGLSRNVATGLKDLCHGLVDEVQVLGVAIDVDYWRPTEAPQTCHLPYTVLFVGNAEPTKNLELLIRAAGKLRSQGFAMRIRVTTELERTSKRTAVARLLALAKELGVGDNLVGSGIVSDMRSVVGEADVHVAPFRSTQGPSDYFISTLEAMAMSKAVVASALPGMSEVIEDGINGLLIDPDSVDDLVDALTQLRNADKRAALGESARQAVSTAFAFPVAFKRVQEVYDSIR